MRKVIIKIPKSSLYIFKFTHMLRHLKKNLIFIIYILNNNVNIALILKFIVTLLITNIQLQFRAQGC